MTSVPPPSPRTPSALWVLAIVPAGLLAGWAVAQLPGPRVKPAEVAAAPGPAPAAEAAPRVEPVHPATAQSEAPPRQPSTQELSQWTTIDAAYVESKRTGKPMLIDFNAGWCGPCRTMKEQLFEDGTLGPMVQMSVIPVSIVDRSREDGNNSAEVERMMQQFQVDAFPTLVVMSPTTGHALRTQGFGGAQATLAWIQDSARRVR